MHDEQLLTKYFKLINPQIDINNSYLLDELLEKTTKITNENYKEIASICKEYLELSKESYSSSYKSYDLYLSLLNTIYMIIKYGGDKFQKEANIIHDGDNILKLLDGAKMFLDITNLFFNKELNEYIIKYSLLESYYIAFYAKLIAIKYIKRCLDNQLTISTDVLIKLESIDSILSKLISLLLIFDEFEELNDTLSSQLADATKKLENKAVLDLQVFSFCIEKGNIWLDKYINYYFGSEQKHWYNLVEKLIKTYNSTIKTCMNIAGKYLCDTIDDLKTKRMLYHSIFYENIALVYAYSNKLYEIADKIIYNGYDYYLELSTLFIIRKYDYVKYYHEIKRLKVICLKRNIETTGYRISGLKDLYGEEFCEEYNRLAKVALDDIDKNNILDPRLNDNRNTPDWAL